MAWHGRLKELPKAVREKMIDESGRIDDDFMRYYVRRMADRQMQGEYAYTVGGAFGMNAWLDATFARTVEELPREALLFLIASQYEEVDHWFNNGGYNMMWLSSMMPLCDLEDGREHEFVRKWVTDICMPARLYEQPDIAVFIRAPCRHGKTTLTNANWRALNDRRSNVLGAGTLHPLAMSNLGDDVVIHMLPFKRNCRQLYESMTNEMDTMLDGDRRLNSILPPFAPSDIVDAASWVSAAGDFTGGGRVGLLKDALGRGVRHFVCCAASFPVLASQIKGLKHAIRCVSFGEFAECLNVIQQMKDSHQSITMGILYASSVIKLGEGASEATEQSFDLFFGPNFVYWSCFSSKPSMLALRIYEDPQTMLMDWLDVYDRNESNGCIIYTDAINVSIDIFGKIAEARNWDFKHGEDPLERRENGTCAEIVLLTAAMLDQDNLEDYLSKMFGMGSRSGGLYKIVMVVTTQPWIGMGVKFCQKYRVQPMSLVFNLKDKKKVMSILQHCERCYGPDGWGLDGQHWIAWDPVVTQADLHGAELVKKIEVGDVRDANVAHTMFMKDGGEYYNLAPVWAAADLHVAMEVQQKLAPNNESHYDALCWLRSALDETDEKYRVLRWLDELARFANIKCSMEGPYVRRFMHNRGATTRLWKAIGAVCCVDFDPHLYHAVRRDDVQSDPATVDWSMDPAHVRQLVAEGTQPDDDPHSRKEYAMAVRFNDWYNAMKEVMPAQVMQTITPQQLEIVAGQLQLAGIDNPKSEWQRRAMGNLVYLYLKESDEFADTHGYFTETEKKKGCRNLGYVCKAYKAACQLLADATLCNLTNDDMPPIHPLLRMRCGLWMADVGDEKHSQLVLPAEWEMPGMPDKPFGGMMMWSEANKDRQSGRALDGREAVDVPTTVWLERAMQQDLPLVLCDKHLGGHNLLARDYVPGQPLTLQTVMHVLDQSTAIMVSRIPHKGAKKKRKGFKHTEHERKTNSKYSLFGGLEYGPPDSFNRDPQRLKDDRDMPHCIKVRALVTTAVSIAALHLDDAKVGFWLKWVSVLGDQGVTDLPILSAMFEGNAQALTTVGELLHVQYPILDGHILEKPTGHELGWLRNMQGMRKHDNVFRLMSKVPVYGQEDDANTSPVALIHLTPVKEWPRGITAGKVISTTGRTMVVRFCAPGPAVDGDRVIDVEVKREMPMQTAIQTLGPLGAPGRPPRESQKDVTNDYNPFVWPKWAEPDAVPEGAGPSYDKRSNEMKRKVPPTP